MLFIYKRINKKETKEAVKGITGWFENNPKRRVCNASVGGVPVKVRKKYVKEDVVEAIGTDYKEKKKV